MDEPQSKKLCRSHMDETSMEKDLSGKEEDLNLAESLDVKMVEKQDLKEVAKWWNLPTRCRLRRVSSHWNATISLPEVNESVFVNLSCPTVTQITRPPTPPSPPRAQRPPQLARKMVNQPPRFLMLARRHFHSQLPSNCRLADYQRGGLMGPHVRQLIYEEQPADLRVITMRCDCGCGSPLRKHDYGFILRAIGTHCPNVRKIVLHGVCLWLNSWGIPDVARMSHWINRPPFPATGFSCLTSLTLMSASLDSHDSVGPLQLPALRLEWKIPFVTLTWRPEEDCAVMDLSGFIWTDVTGHREWVARQAKDLPANCQEFLSAVDLKNLNWTMKGEPLNPDTTFDISTMNYATAPLAVILVLAALIQDQLPSARADQPAAQPSDIAIRWGNGGPN